VDLTAQGSGATDSMDGLAACTLSTQDKDTDIASIQYQACN